MTTRIATKTVTLLVSAALALRLTSAPTPARAEMSDGEKAAALLAIIGIAALATSAKHYPKGYTPRSDLEKSEFARGYSDGLKGARYWEDNQTVGYEKGYQAGEEQRDRDAQAQQGQTGAPFMASKGCAEIVARNFGVNPRRVTLGRARPSSKHVWMIEAAVGRDYMTCTMRDSGEVLDLRGGRF